LGYSQANTPRRPYFIVCAATIAAIFLVGPASFAQAPAADPTLEASFPQDFNKYPGLLAEIGQFVNKLLENTEFPAARSESRILPLFPESTVSYVAIPNYGEVAYQTLKTFRVELQENAVLRDWWQHGQLAATGPKIEDFLEKFDQLHQYLGDEIALSGSLDGRTPSFLVVAEVRKPGLQNFLQQTLDQVTGKSKPGVRLFDLHALAATKDQGAFQELSVLVRPDFVIAAPDLATLRSFNERLEGKSAAFAATPFGQTAKQEYAGGVTVLGAFDLQKILSQIPHGTDLDRTKFRNSGFADLKYLIWDHKSVAGQTVSQSELSFTAPRHGAAAWLASSRPLSTLDFVSPTTIVAGTMVLNDPPQIFEDLKRLTSSPNSSPFATLTQFEKALKFNLKNDVLSYLAGELTLELDDVTPPKPAWKAILKVSDAAHLQQTLTTLLATMRFEAQRCDDAGITYYTVKIPSATTATEIGYAFVDGHLIIASSRETVAEAIQLHRTGESLAKSKALLAALPPGHSLNASALLYQDPIAMSALQMRRFAPEIAGSIAKLAGQGTPAVVGVYGEETVIREASRSTGFDAGAALIVAAVAIPNLLRSRIAANEASAVGSIRTVNTAQVMYAATYPRKGYAPNLATLGPNPRGGNRQSPDHADLVDESLANESCTAYAWCTKSGFHFRVTAVCQQHACMEYVSVATPVNSNTGTRSFCSTSDGVIRFKKGDPLTSPVSLSECRTWEPLH